MQIKVGGVYRDREGRKVKIVEDKGVGSEAYPAHRFRTQTGNTYTSDGKYLTGEKSDRDLIAEWTDEPAAVESEMIATAEEISAKRPPILVVDSADAFAFGQDCQITLGRNGIRALEEAVAASRRDAPEPDPCDYRESAETLAAALRVFLRAMPETSPANDPLIDAAAFARLALDGYAP